LIQISECKYSWQGLAVRKLKYHHEPNPAQTLGKWIYILLGMLKFRICKLLKPCLSKNKFLYLILLLFGIAPKSNQKGLVFPKLQPTSCPPSLEKHPAHLFVLEDGPKFSSL
jgi:hypothetical protein